MGPRGSRRVGIVLSVAGLVSLWPGRAAPVSPAAVSPAAISVNPPCPPTTPTSPAPIVVTGVNFNPFTPVLVTFDAGAGGRPDSVAGRTDGFGRFTITIVPGPRPPGLHVMRVDDLRGREATADYLTPCHPTLVLRPAVGPPGFVAEVFGSDFPPGAAVQLSWSPGLSQKRPVVADTDGRFRAAMLVFSRDILGPRRLQAAPAGPATFGSAEASFIVIERTFIVGGKG